MKKLITFIALGAFGMISNVYGQVTNYYPYTDSIPGCGQNALVVYVQGGVDPETGGILSIDWGDGTTGTENFTLAGANSSINLTINHTYASTGIYTVQTSVYSTTAGANVDAGQTNQMTVVDPSACGYIYSGVYQNAPYYNYYSAPIDFTDVNGLVTTINLNGMNAFGYYQGLNPANAPYTVSVNDTWLSSNGLTQVTSDGTITSFDANGMANLSQYYFEVTCSVGAANPDFGFSYLWASNFVAPLETGTLFFDVCNYACANSSDASISIEMPVGFIPNTSSLTNAVVNGTTLTFDMMSLTNCTLIEIPFTFPGTTPAGTQICFDLTISNPNDTDLSNNATTICGWVLNSYDPNDKQVDQPTYINPSAQESFNYMIQFQNEGNYQAVNVVVTDTLDANLDLSTFRVLGAKHAVATTLNPTTRVVTFTFSNINLAPSSQDVEASKGFIMYQIEENAGLPLDSEIENTAYIYFDFNPAIITNTTLNVNSTLSVNELDNETIAMYPNPAQNLVQFSGATIESVSIYDLSGKEVLVNNSVLSNNISIEHLTNGLYQAIVTTAKGTHNMKLVVKK
jgi:fimbrial isopeptide formation D2 family protein